MPIDLALIPHKRSNTSYWLLVLFLIHLNHGYNTWYLHLSVHILVTYTHIERKIITLVSSKKMHYRIKPFFCLLRLVSLLLAFLKSDITLFTKHTLNNCAINLQNNQVNIKVILDRVDPLFFFDVQCFIIIIVYLQE